MNRTELTVEQILAWADQHHAHIGRWPRTESGPVCGAAGETWSGLNLALAKGRRGLPAGDTLARLLARERQAGRARRRPLTVEQILAWADEHHAQLGRWPGENSGRVTAAPREDWNAINRALRQGLRGLPGADSLARLLARHGRGQQRQGKSGEGWPAARRCPGKGLLG
jgi:pyrroloquinoline quinone (PQQ) biosynthesis protein C